MYRQYENRPYGHAAISPNDPASPWYPGRYERRVRFGFFEWISSLLFISFALLLIAGITALFIHVVGFDQLTHMYGFNEVIQHFNIGPPPHM